MKNSWFTYGFLLLLAVALCSLAILQYRWVGSVSEAERKRVEETLDASTENFISDFNDVFSELTSIFRLQVASEVEEIAPVIEQSMAIWKSQAPSSELIEAIYFVRNIESENPEILKYHSTRVELETFTPNQQLQSWIDSTYSNASENSSLISLQTFPEFSDPTYMRIPVQILRMIQFQENDRNKNMEVRLNLDQSDDELLIAINDEYVKEVIIPEIARTYLSDSFEEQYRLTILKDGKTPFRYYQSEEDTEPGLPDVAKKLDRFNFSNIMMFTERERPETNFSLSDFSLSDSAKMEISFWETNSDIEVRDEDEEVAASVHLLTRRNRVTTSDSQSSTADGFRNQQTDTTFNTSIVGSIQPSGWMLWLTFKEGSLDAYIAKSRTRNLGISFGILFILGISSSLIVIFAQRSRDLAEQQMLFVAGVSHELRTPLSVIRSAAENLTQGVVQTEERKQKYAQLMLREGRRLSDMVDQIMEFSGIQTGKRVYSVAEVSVNALVDEAVEECTYLLEEKNLSLEQSRLHTSQTMEADREALFLSLVNLLQNAIKFSERNASIVLRVDDTELHGRNAIRFQVQDYGIGISQEEQKSIFKPFYRGKKAVENQTKGNGIGLSLVEKVVQAHGGKVMVKSEPTIGSTFSLIFPIKKL